MTDSFKPKAGAKKTNHDDDQCGPYSQRDNAVLLCMWRDGGPRDLLNLVISTTGDIVLPRGESMRRATQGIHTYSLQAPLQTEAA